MEIRSPAVAGTFYPADPEQLAEDVERYLADVEVPGEEAFPKALIAPHAGYVYSGPVAASAWARLAAGRGRIRRVLLLGPSHRVPLGGMALPSVEAFDTPLGRIPLDREALARVASLPEVAVRDDAHRLEHSLEVHLPFLQVVLGDVRLVPVVVGDASAEAVARVIEAFWSDPETAVVVSSDLSHYHDYERARRRDAATSEAIEALRLEAIEPDDACGCFPVRGLLLAARRDGLGCRTVDLRSSGDTAGPRDRVVGYGSYVVA